MSLPRREESNPKIKNNYWLQGSPMKINFAQKIGHFRGGLISSLLAKKPSKWLKMHSYGQKGEKIS